MLDDKKGYFTYMLQKLTFFDFAQLAPTDDRNYAAPHWLLHNSKNTFFKAYKNDRAIYYPKQNMSNLTFEPGCCSF